jgi:ubiquinone/menaquinone biosynthesis C-methylase UbiE
VKRLSFQRVTVERIRRDYTPLARVYETRWAALNSAVRQWVLARWPTELSAGARVLDLGCGTGAFLGAVAARYRDLALVGLDATPALLAEAHRAVPTARLVEGDAEAPPFVSHAFDVVCSLNVTQHLNDPAAHLSEMARLCRPGGTTFVSAFASGRTLAMRAVNLWLRLSNPAWRGASSQAEMRRMLATEPRFALTEQSELRAGSWWVQLYRLTAVDGTCSPAARNAGTVEDG